MADDLVVTDEVLEDPLVLKRLLSDIIERLSNTVNEVADDDLTNKVINIIAGSNISAIEIQDDGVTISKAPTKFNFVGFNLSEPVADEIDISLGAVGASNQYCPNYDYSKVTDSQFTIDLADASKLFYTGRRLSFNQNGVSVFGTIASRDYNSTFANDTTVNMTMSGGAVVPEGLFDVCLVSSSSAWQAVSGDPFTNSVITDVCTGLIGTTQWYFAVAHQGKIAVSSNAGATWTQINSGTPSFWNCCVYDSDSERFWAAGNNGFIGYTADCINFVLDITSIPALPGGGTKEITGIAYSSSNDHLAILYENGGFHREGYSTNKGVTWVNNRSLGSSYGNKRMSGEASASGTSNRAIALINNNVASYYINPYTSIAWNQLDTVLPASPISMGLFWDGASARVYGTSSGGIDGRGSWSSNDTTTFAVQINDFAYSTQHDRLVCVGNSGVIGYQDGVNKAVNDTWTSVANGGDPQRDISAVCWNGVDMMFVAVTRGSQILRSTNGIN